MNLIAGSTVIKCSSNNNITLSPCLVIRRLMQLSRIRPVQDKKGDERMMICYDEKVSCVASIIQLLFTSENISLAANLFRIISY